MIMIMTTTTTMMMMIKFLRNSWLFFFPSLHETIKSGQKVRIFPYYGRNPRFTTAEQKIK
jgi:hypothetical protein